MCYGPMQQHLWIGRASYQLGVRIVMIWLPTLSLSGWRHRDIYKSARNTLVHTHSLRDEVALDHIPTRSRTQYEHAAGAHVS